MPEIETGRFVGAAHGEDVFPEGLVRLFGREGRVDLLAPEGRGGGGDTPVDLRAADAVVEEILDGFLAMHDDGLHALRISGREDVRVFHTDDAEIRGLLVCEFAELGGEE